MAESRSWESRTSSGFKAIAIALDAYRRDVSNVKHDITWDALNFNGTDIYSDPLAPSATAQYYIPLSGNAGASGNTSLVDSVGKNTTTVAYTTPQFFGPTGAAVALYLCLQAREHGLAAIALGASATTTRGGSGWMTRILPAPDVRPQVGRAAADRDAVRRVRQDG